MKSFIKLFPLACICLGLSSCLDKEDPLTNRDTEASPNIIEFYSEDPAEAPTEEHIYAEFTKSFDIVPEANFNIPISYSGANNAPEDIVVDVVVDEAALLAFNAKVIADARAAAVKKAEDDGITDPAKIKEAADHAEEDIQGELYTLMPTSLYTLGANKVTIKKGERRANLPVTVKPNMFDFAFKYGLPLKLSSASMGTLSGNFGTAIFNIGAKNEWHGEYNNTYSRTRLSNGTTVTSGTNTETLLTTGAYSLAGKIIGLYSNPQFLEIDPATNKVNVVLDGFAVTDNKSYYDPAKKTFFIEYTALNTIMKSTLVKK